MKSACFTAQIRAATTTDYTLIIQVLISVLRTSIKDIASFDRLILELMGFTGLKLV